MSRGAAGLLLMGALLAGLPPLPEGCPVLEAIPPAPPKLPTDDEEGADMPGPQNRHQRRKAMAAARRANKGRR